jgi:hypothetical protein
MDLDSRGQFIKLIPSLNGRLYKFNGEVVEPIPMNVDSLLGTYLPYQNIMNEIAKEEINGYFVQCSGCRSDGSVCFCLFWPPGSGSISQRYGSGSGAVSFYHQAKIVRKTLIPTVL